MRTRFGLTLGLALATVAVLAPAAGAEFRLGRREAPRRASVETFTFSGACSGAISDEVRVDGRGYRLARDARIYELGVGLVPAGTAYYDRVVTVSGRKVRNVLIVDNVLVRAATYTVGPGTVSILDASAPR
jgi:hypothetical protein